MKLSKGGFALSCALIGTTLIPALPSPVLAQEAKPNVVFILVDWVGAISGFMAEQYPRRASTSSPARAFASTTTT